MKNIYLLKNLQLRATDAGKELSFENAQADTIKLFGRDVFAAEQRWEFLGETTSGHLTFQPQKQHLAEYQVVFPSERITFRERLVPLTGAINVRDMGGYETTDGRRVKWGQLYRGDQLSQLTPADCSLLNKLGFRTIIDFRSEEEQALNPNAELDSVLATVSCDPHATVAEVAGGVVGFEEENKRIVANLAAGAVPSEELNGKGLAFHRTYRDFVNKDISKQAYRRMLKTLVEPSNAPIFMHCRGGKDRTGFGAALTLALLGVSQEDIIADYLITQTIREERTAFKMAQYAKYTDNPDILAYLKAMIDTRADYIEASFTAIFEQYDQISEYVRNELGLTVQEIDQIKANFLTE